MTDKWPPVGTRQARILEALPATVCELSALESVSVRLINADLCWLRAKGLAKRTNLRGMRYEQRGPRPAIWVSAQQKET